MDKNDPKYIVRRIDDDGIGFYIIHDKVGPVYLVERYDDVPFHIFSIGLVPEFDPDGDIESTKLYEIKTDTVTENELFYTQKGAIGEAFRIAKTILEEKNNDYQGIAEDETPEGG